MHVPGYTRIEATDITAGAREAWEVATGSGTEPGERRTGRVLRAFDRTAYIAFEEDGRPLPRVLMLGTAAIPDGPLLVRTDAGPAFRFSDAIDDRATCGVRSAAGTGDGYVLTVGTTLDVAVPSPVLEREPAVPSIIRPLADIDHGGPAWKRARSVLRTVREDGMTDGLGWLEEMDEPTDHAASRQVAETVIALLETDRPQDVDIGPMTGLVGLGPGSTPSGDDILAGILFTLARTTTGTGRERVEQVAERIIGQGSGATTTMSLALLEQAAAGRAPAAVERCLTAFLEHEPERTCHEAATAMMEIGHSSGADSLAGMLVTLLTIAPRIETGAGRQVL